MRKERALRKIELPLVSGLSGAVLMACITGVAAMARIPLPFTPVPLTFQVFAVLLSGVLLGKRYGVLSQALYIFAGAAGVPWFAGGLFGPTGGYLIGFIPAAFIAGASMNRYVKMMLAVLVIYALGAVQFSVVTGADISVTLQMAVIPFIGFDVLKGLLVSMLLGAGSRTKAHRSL